MRLPPYKTRLLGLPTESSLSSPTSPAPHRLEVSPELLVLGDQLLQAALGHAVLVQGLLELALELVVVGLELLQHKQALNLGPGTSQTTNIYPRVLEHLEHIHKTNVPGIPVTACFYAKVLEYPDHRRWTKDRGIFHS